jgi:hypothetical protein
VEEREISYYKYPQELQVVECFYEILDKLELIGSMEAYVNVYQIMNTQSFDGRHIYLVMEKFRENRPMENLEKCWQEVRGYGSYAYMKKKWDKCQKELPFLTEEDSWENVIEMMDNFFTPILESLEKNEIFMGDWMPKLGRYL